MGAPLTGDYSYMAWFNYPRNRGHTDHHHPVVGRQVTQHGVAAIIAAIFVIPLWMLLDRVPPYRIDEGRVIPQMPLKNSDITVEWDVTPLRSCATQGGYVTRTIIDQKGIPHTYKAVNAVYTTNDQFKEDQIKRNIPLPENITGPATYSSYACYPCNPLQLWLHMPICIQTPTLQFEIIESKAN